MKKIAFIIILLASFTVLSCRVKESCELNHTAMIAVINNYNSSLELRIDGEKIGDIDTGMVRKVAKPVANSYNINLKSYPNEWDTIISLSEECKVIEFKASKANVSSSLLDQ